jgi:hypothetical protein
MWLLLISLAHTKSSLVRASPLLIVEFNKPGLATPALQLAEESPGILTPTGRTSKEGQGRALREAFSVPEEFNANYFEFRTVQEDLYIDSVAAYIHGLFPEVPFNISMVKTAPRSVDPVLSPRDCCPRIDWLTQRDQMTSSRYQNLVTSLEPFSEVLLSLTNSSDFTGAVLLGEALSSLQKRNVSLPDIPEDLAKLAIRAYNMQQSFLPYGNEEAVAIGAYSMLEELLQLILEVANSRSQLKVAVFTVEASAFSALLRALSMQKFLPETEAHLVVAVEHNYTMSFLYNGQPIQFTQCQTPCLVKHFYRAVAAVTFENKDEWTAACGRMGDEKGWNQSHIMVFIMSAAALFSMAFLMKDKEKQD